MDAKAANGEIADSQNAVSGAKPTSLSPPSSEICTFFLESENSEHLLPLAKQISEFVSVLPESGMLISAEVGLNNTPFAALDSLLREMEDGKEASDLQAPHDYRKSMVSLSDQSLVPVSVSSPKPLNSQKAKKWDDQSAINLLDMNLSQSTILPSSSGAYPLAQHDDGIHRSSVYSMSVYSENSSNACGSKASSSEGSFSSNSMTGSPHAENAANASADKISQSHVPQVGASKSNESTDTLTPRPLQISASTSRSLTRSSLPHQVQTFFLDDSSTESKPSSPLSTHQSNESREVAQEKQYETSSELASCGSSEDIPESNNVTPAQSFIFYR